MSLFKLGIYGHMLCSHLLHPVSLNVRMEFGIWDLAY